MQVFYYKGSIRFTQYVYFQLSLTLMASQSILLHLSLRKANVYFYSNNSWLQTFYLKQNFPVQTTRAYIVH